MKTLQDILAERKSHLSKVIVTAGQNQVVSCGSITDPDFVKELEGINRRYVASVGHTGTYLLVRLEQEVA